MVCSKCGALVDDNITVCDNCGYIFEDNVAKAETDGSEYNINPNTPALADAFEDEKPSVRIKNVWLLVCIVASVAILVLFFYGAHYVSKAGLALNSMQMSSQSFFGFGDGANSDYYRFIGAALYGMAYAIRGTGVAFAVITLLAGIKTKKD